MANRINQPASHADAERQELATSKAADDRAEIIEANRQWAEKCNNQQAEIERLRGLLQAASDERDAYRQAMQEAYDNPERGRMILAKALQI